MQKFNVQIDDVGTMETWDRNEVINYLSERMKDTYNDGFCSWSCEGLLNFYNQVNPRKKVKHIKDVKLDNIHLRYGKYLQRADSGILRSEWKWLVGTAIEM